MNRYADGDTLRHEGRVDPSSIPPITMTSHSPLSSPSWDISSESSAESGIVPDVPTAGPIPDQIGFGGMYYEHLPHGHYHPRWEFKFPDPGHSASSRTLEHSADIPAVSSPQLAGPRGAFTTRPLPGLGGDGVSYTDEANTKISNRLRRQCFNCKATETSTWRRSVLSPGKLVGHQGYSTERLSSNSIAAMQQVRALRTHACHSPPEEIPPKTDARLKGHPTSLCTSGHGDSFWEWARTSSLQRD